MKNIKRYVFTFLLILITMIGLLLMEKSIPNTKSRENIVKSEQYYYNYYDYQFSNISILKNRHEMIDSPAELYHLGMIYLETNKHPWQEFIEMNYDSECVQKMMDKNSFKSFKIDSDYSRYWNGHLIILKPLLSFFSMPTIYNIYLGVFSIIYMILLIMLFRHSKILTIIFVIASVVINLFFVTTCDNLIHVFTIAMIASIIVIKMYEEKSKQVDLVFLISGMLAVYFDLISCETITLSLPLFVYVLLHMLDGKRFRFKELLKYVLLWLGGYVGTFVAKWILLVIHYHGSFTDKVLNPMLVRIYYKDVSFLKVFLDTMKEFPKYLYPFGHNIIKVVVIVIGIITYIINLIKDNKNRNNYILLGLIALIPIIRYLVLSSHSNYHNYFTYRAFLTTIIFLLINIFYCIKSFMKKYNHI